MLDDLSNDPADKLQAVLKRDRPDSDRNSLASYIDACRRWYAGLSDSDRVVAILAAALFAKGNELEAKTAAAVLPPGPKYPLS